MTGYPVTIKVLGAADLDSCKVALPVTIIHGRSSIDNMPDAPKLTFTYLGSVAPCVTGSRLTVIETEEYDSATWDDPVATWDSASVLWGGTATYDRARFVGHVSSIVPSEIEGEVTSWSIEAVGVQASLAGQDIKLTRNIESDIARVGAIAAAAGVTIKVRGTNSLQLAAAVIETNALNALQDVCASSGGLLWQTPDGALIYGTAEHRLEDETDPSVIPCTIIGDGLSWGQNQELIVNHVRVTWGPENSQSETTMMDSDSMDQPWGKRHVDIATACASQADAEAFGALVLTRRAWPYWGTPDIITHMHLTTAPDRRALMQLDVSSPVFVPYQMTPGPVPTDYSLGIVEGWVETWDASGHVMQFAIGDAKRWVFTSIRNWREAKEHTWSHWKHGSWTDQMVKRGI